jgi:hypothetical protein
VESSTWTDYRRSFCRASRSNVSCHFRAVGYLQADVQMSNTREREKSSKVKTSQRSAQDTTRMVRDFFPSLLCDTDKQSYSTTTRQSGDPGTIENPLSGVSHVVILPVSFAFLLSKHKLIVSIRILLYRPSRSRRQLGPFHRRLIGNTRRT